MRVFVTGATGFIGSAIVDDLIKAGHQVVGLARSEASAKKLLATGAKVVRGDIEDLAALRRGAAMADGAIHTAFYHAIGHMKLATRLRVMLGGSPTNIVNRFFAAALGANQNALETIAASLTGSDRPIVSAFVTMALKPGSLGKEGDAYDPQSAGGPRGKSEAIIKSLAQHGSRSSVIRVPPLVHGVGDRAGLTPMLIKIARKKNESAFVGDGQNRWPAVHRLDIAHLFRLALEQGPAGGVYHGVAEEGVAFKEIAASIGRGLKLPAVSIPPAAAAKRFGFLSPFITADNPVSSELTRDQLGWSPTRPGFLADIQVADYFKS